MNWFMDVLSLYGGGVFCVLVMIGFNVSSISSRSHDIAANNLPSFSLSSEHINKTFGIPLRAMLAIVVIDLTIG